MLAFDVHDAGTGLDLLRGKYEENRKHGFGKMIYRRGVDREFSEFSDLRLNTSHRMKKAMM